MRLSDIFISYLDRNILSIPVWIRDFSRGWRPPERVEMKAASRGFAAIFL
jgi:hypothetical protein